MTATTKPIFRSFAIWGLQLVGSLILLGVSYWWLTWPDEETWQVVASLCVALVVVAAALWLERTVFAAFHHDARAGYISPASLLAFTVWVAIIAVVEFMVAIFNSEVERIAVRLAQIAHLPPRATVAGLDWAGWGAFWVIVPALFLPFASLAAREGFAAFRRSRASIALATLRNPRYWGGLLIALGIGAYIPYRLINWIPEQRSLRAELWSAGLRLSAAYILAVTAVVFLSWCIARTMPGAEAQPAVEESASVSA